MKFNLRFFILSLFSLFFIYSEVDSFRFVTFGDSRGELTSPYPPIVFHSIVKQIANLRPKPSFWVFLGNAFYGYTNDSTEILTRWLDWKERVTPIISIPHYMVIGNHDANITSKLDGAWFFRATWPENPQNGPEGLKGLAYHFEHEDCYFVVLDTDVFNKYSSVDLNQRLWLEESLKKTEKKYRIAFGHTEAFGPVINQQRSMDDFPNARDSLWTIFVENNVSAYICANYHCFNRDYFGRTLGPYFSKTRQIVCGTSAASIDSGYGGEYYHFVVWDFKPPKLIGKVIDDKGDVKDTFSLNLESQQKIMTTPSIRTIKISYDVPKPKDGSLTVHITIVIFDEDGKVVRFLFDGEKQPGKHSIVWDGKDETGNDLESGTYLYQIQKGDEVSKRKSIALR